MCGGIFLRKKTFIKNAVFLTVTSLILRFVGVFFRVWLSRTLGAEGMGLYQLVISVYVLASAFASGGLTTAVTRQVSDRLSFNDGKGAKRAVLVSVILTLIVALFSIILIYGFSNQIAKFFIKDIRAVAALKTLCLGLPFMGVASCFKGYFLARRKASSPSFALILEQTVRMILVFIFVSDAAKISLSYACATVLFCDGLSEGASCIYLYFGYLKDKKNIVRKGKQIKFKTLIKENLRISVPITAGKYLSSFLRTVENLLMPQNLAKYTSSYKTSLEQFGMIKGMALPILFFPASLLSSITTLLIPEVSEAKAKGNNIAIKKAVIKSFKITLYSAYILGGIFLTCANSLGVLIYKSEEVGFLIKAIAPLVPVMYLDSMADGLLKGIDRQNNTLFHSFIDSVLRIILILVVVPKFGLLGFLCIMYISNFLTCFLNVGRLLKDVKVKFLFQDMFIKPLFFAAVSLFISHLILLPFSYISNIFYLVVFSLLSGGFYGIMLYFGKLITKKQFLDLYK